ncbi:hypothetical protein A6R68_14271 [Neotoma lepida]|uniref:LIM zinc-binding domain-containing protein n=1 Tax=Neotoma lepida TaxID=56216 RepID=A0A1A6HC42_NEOLE|nr:hypothetical protein A6R68_14271 [Neotoma lepida]
MHSLSEPQAAHAPLEKPASTAILCSTCGNVCKGEVLRVQNKYFHIRCFVCKGCGGCGLEIKNGQALVALDKHWHLGCFKCKTCGKLLNAEYISKDGLPYCEADYHTKFGIRCDSCEKYITGRVLEIFDPSGCWAFDVLMVQLSQMCAQGRCLSPAACYGLVGTHCSDHTYLLCAFPRPGRSTTTLHARYVSGAARCSQRERRCTCKAPLSGTRHVDKRPGLKIRARLETRTSSESIVSVPASSTSGSPSRVIYAKLGDEILDYRDLAALPKNKAIYNIDRPDMISYSPYISHSAMGDRQSYGEGDQDDRSYKQCRTSSPSSAGSVSLGHYTPTSRSPQHYSRPAGTVSVGTSSCLSLSQHPSPTSVFRHHYIPYFRGSESGRSTPSLSVLSDSRPPSSTYQQAPRHFHVPDTGVKDNIYRKPPIYKQHGPVAQSPMSKLSDLVSVLSLVVQEAGRSKRRAGLSPPQAAAARRLDVEDSSFEQDSRKKTTWLLLKGDTDTRTNSPDLDSQSLSLSSGAEREPLQRMPGDSLYSREWLF